MCFDSDLPRGGSGHYWCNSQGAVGASGVVSARILAIQRGVRGASFSAAADFFGAGRILPLWARDGTQVARHGCWDARGAVAVSGSLCVNFGEQ